MGMTTKNISIMDDVYRLLEERKRENESFSDVLRRELGTRKDFLAFAGAWKGLPERKVRKIKREIKELKRRSTTELLSSP